MRARRIRLLGLALLSMATLPPDLFPTPWLVAIAFPSSLLGVLRIRNVPVYLAYPLALSAQFAALPIAWYLTERSLDMLALLGATLIPPMMLSAVRSDAADTHRTLFLSFCALLIGSILGEPAPGLIGAFAALGISILHAEQAVQPRRRVTRTTQFDGRALRGLTYGLIGVFATVGMLEVLRAVSPTSTRTASRSGVGIDGTFALDETQNAPLDFYADEILRVTAPEPRRMLRVPSSLYLRSHAFEIPGTSEWDRRPTPRVPAPSDPWPIERSNGSPGLELNIELVQPFEPFAYVPASAVSLSNTEGMIGDAYQGRFEYAEIPRDGSYLVARIEFSRTPVPADRPRRTDPQLLNVPEFFEQRRAFFEPILQDSVVRSARETGSALRFADAIARRLGRTHRYERTTPTGPHDEMLLNFLAGSRSGYCMHFAMTTALCLRMSGIPARLAVGLYSGEEADPMGQVRTFGSRHAHAWVEIPYERAGWIVVDPTPPAARANPNEPLMPKEETPYSDGLESRTEEASKDSRLASLDDLLIWSLAAVGTIAVALVALAWLRRGKRSARRRATTAPLAPRLGREPQRRLAQILQRLRKAGCVRMPLEPLDALAGRAIDVGIAGPELRDAFRAYDEVRFGGRAWTEEHRRRMQSVEIHRVDAVKSDAR